MIVFDQDALGDLERTLEFNLQRDAASAFDHIAKIREAVLILERHPEIGRLADARSGLRELVISHGHTGYVALYECSKPGNPVRILAIRHQREAGYRGK